MKKAANTQAISSAVGAGVGGALSFAGPVGMAAGGLVSAGANAFGGYKAAEMVAKGTKEAAQISGGGAMFMLQWEQDYPRFLILETDRYSPGYPMRRTASDGLLRRKEECTCNRQMHYLEGQDRSKTPRDDMLRQSGLPK